MAVFPNKIHPIRDSKYNSLMTSFIYVLLTSFLKFSMTSRSVGRSTGTISEITLDEYVIVNDDWLVDELASFSNIPFTPTSALTVFTSTLTCALICSFSSSLLTWYLNEAIR